MLTMWYLAILHHLGWAAGPWELPDGLGSVSKKGAGTSASPIHKEIASLLFYRRA
jgi:hypothetical protein